MNSSENLSAANFSVVTVTELSEEIAAGFYGRKVHRRKMGGDGCCDCCPDVNSSENLSAANFSAVTVTELYEEIAAGFYGRKFHRRKWVEMVVAIAAPALPRVPQFAICAKKLSSDGLPTRGSAVSVGLRVWAL